MIPARVPSALRTGKPATLLATIMLLAEYTQVSLFTAIGVLVMAVDALNIVRSSVATRPCCFLLVP